MLCFLPYRLCFLVLRFVRQHFVGTPQRTFQRLGLQTVTRVPQSALHLASPFAIPFTRRLCLQQLLVNPLRVRVVRVYL